MNSSKPRIVVPGYMEPERTEEELNSAEEARIKSQEESERIIKESFELSEKKHIEESKELKFQKRLAESDIISIEAKLQRKRKLESLIDQRESASSLVLLNEAEMSIQHVENALDFDVPNMTGFYIRVKLHHESFDTLRFKRKDGTDSLIAMPEDFKEHLEEKQKYRACCGLVIGMGPDCYKDMEKFSGGPWCRIGDFVSFMLHNASQTMYKGFAVADLPDDKIMCVIQSPKDVSIS